MILFGENKVMIKKLLILIQLFLLGSFTGCSKDKDFKLVLNKFEPRIFNDIKYKHPLPYRLFIPDNYNSAKKYPLVLILHSGGWRGVDNQSQIRYAASVLTDDQGQLDKQCFIFVPQCHEKSQWLNIDFKTVPFKNYQQENIPESDVMKMVIEVIHLLEKEFSIDNRRLYITGSSMGGSGTWDIITRYPNLFAAAVPVNGVSDPSTASVVSKMPIWAFHGRKDRISDVKNTRNMINALKENGSICKYTEFKNKGHDISSLVYNSEELIHWIFLQKK